MAKETQRIKAYTMFLQKDQSAAFWKELANQIGISVNALRKWSIEENWVERKKEFFKNISRKVDGELDEVASKIAKLKVEFAQDIIASVKDRFQQEIAEIPIGSFKEMMQGIDSAINAVDRLLNISPDSEKEEVSPYASLTIEQKKQLLETINTVKIQLPTPTELGEDNRDNIIDEELEKIKGDREQSNGSNT